MTASRPLPCPEPYEHHAAGRGYDDYGRPIQWDDCPTCGGSGEVEPACHESGDDCRGEIAHHCGDGHYLCAGHAADGGLHWTECANPPTCACGNGKATVGCEHCFAWRCERCVGERACCLAECERRESADAA